VVRNIDENIKNNIGGNGRVGNIVGMLNSIDLLSDSKFSSSLIKVMPITMSLINKYQEILFKLLIYSLYLLSD